MSLWVLELVSTPYIGARSCSSVRLFGQGGGQGGKKNGKLNNN